MMGYSNCTTIEKGQDFCQQMSSMEFSEQWDLTLSLTGAQHELLKALSQGLGYVVSDRSFKDDRGMAAWIIKGTTSNLWLTGQWHMPGQPSDHSLFHSEVAGIVGILYTLTFWPPKSNKPPFHLVCDKLSVITHLTTLQPIDLTEPHMDLLVAACNLINQSEYLVQIMFVCGHQDMGNPTVLSRDMWLNVEGDQLAKHKTSLPHIGPLYYKLPGYPWGCYLGKQHVIKQLQHSLWKFINGKDMLKYWEQWKQSLQDLLQEVDWQSLGCAIQSIPLSKHRWSTKQMSGHFAHGKNMVRLQQRSTAEFPQCRMTIEDKTHIIRCTQAEATSTWMVAITALMKWMKDRQTDPQLITVLTLGLQAW